MKKYRLIREYPGSPKLGKILTWTDNIFDDVNTFAAIHYGKVINPENYPEFWEEVIEKDYEILSLLGNDNKVIPYLTNTKCIDFLVNNGFKIYSIKRLSDGEVFTIGDKIKHITDTRDNIKSFQLLANTIYISGTQHTSKFEYHLSNIEKNGNSFIYY